LRRHWREAGLSEGFQILDAEDQLRIVRRVLQGLGMDETKFPPREVRAFVNRRKDEGVRPQHIQPQSSSRDVRLLDAYREYQASCEKAGVVDFAELLLRAHELLRDNDELLNHYRDRFRYVLVDEFQDTNAVQYAWLRLLTGTTGALFAVGDDDQSIYGWRGARVENFLSMEEDFPGTRTFRLEQNYRSTANILEAANALIACNGGRVGKNLWTDGVEGELIELYTAFNERDEARFVVERIKSWVEEGGRRGEVAVLYRSNAQSRAFEEQLVMQAVPYRVYGGLRFFERAEIKDALAYLRLMVNREDDASFERAVNMPPRGIGARTLEAIRECARGLDMPLYRAAQSLLVGKHLASRAAKALGSFLELIETLSDENRNSSLGQLSNAVILASGLLEHHAKDRSGRGEDRVENLKELVTAARGFEPDPELTAETEPLTAFLAHAALESGEVQADAGVDGVQLMTLHSAKGLEFALVFVVGMEDGLFPTARSREDPSKLEEERRLFYVGMTRACQRLVLTHAERRRLYGSELPCRRSLFLSEVPAALLQDLRPRAHVSRPLYQPPQRASHPAVEEANTLTPGTGVMHPRFGEGVVLRYEGSGRHARVEVNFREHGGKWLVLSFANLQPL
jgi:DNA helicase-2/ATP-dependent DNA helicase PcrA